MDDNLITFRIIFYNHEQYVDQCVQSVFAQTHTPLQIVFSDDCSTDKTFDRLKRSVDGYAGPHEVVLNQTPRNLGVSAHLNSIHGLTRAKLEVCGAGDDYFQPTRAAKVFAKWQSLGRPSCSIFSQHMRVDDAGTPLGVSGDTSFRSATTYQRIADHDPTIFGSYPGCAQSYTTDQWRIFGDLDERIIANDVSRQLRSALIGGVAYIPEPLVYYRQTRSSLSRFGHRSYDAYIKKRIAYLRNFRFMIDQFLSDATVACDKHFITAADRDWAIDAAERYWQARERELQGLAGPLSDRLRVAVGPHRSSRSYSRSILSACFPRFVHWLRGR